MASSRPNSISGFSIIELLIVVAFIGIVSAVALPNLLSSRRAANEGSAIASLGTLFSANMAYAASIGNGNYAGGSGSLNTSSIAALADSYLVDPALGHVSKSGFLFLGDRAPMTPTVPPTLYFTANPFSSTGITRTGSRRFGMAGDGVVKYDSTAQALGQPFDEATLRGPLSLPVAD